MDPVVLHKEIFKANEQFYHAFERLDIKSMDQVWAREDRVICIHPGWEKLVGWPEVRDSWVRIFNHTLSMTFTISDISIGVRGPVAWVVCTENIETKIDDTLQNSKILATNIFEQRGKRWAMVLHHGSPVFSAPAKP